KAGYALRGWLGRTSTGAYESPDALRIRLRRGPRCFQSQTDFFIHGGPVFLKVMCKIHCETLFGPCQRIAQQPLREFASAANAHVFVRTCTHMSEPSKRP